MAINTEKLQEIVKALEEQTRQANPKIFEKRKILDFYRDRDVQSWVSPTQVIHDTRQITRPEQLEAGKKYIGRHSHSFAYILFNFLEIR